MSKVSRRGFLSALSALVPSFLMTKAQASPAFSFSKSGDPKLGALLGKSSQIKVGQTQIYSGKETSGRVIEVILTRTKKGLTALDGTCTHQGCTVGLDRKQKKIVCPCHGSVFDPATGDVILGPNGAPRNSINPLTKYTITEKAGNIYIR
ncbi:MAG TPA: Rieske (2Fe-2S) protein [Candidatus Nanopelagicaceae bacterium]